jgi:hypothetical protein
MVAEGTDGGESAALSVTRTVSFLAEGADGGESAALSVTRTVSFFRGTLDVCLEAGGWFSFSLMHSEGFKFLIDTTNANWTLRVKLPAWDF